MEVSCPNCYATYPINPERIPEKGATPTCKKCGVAFTIVKATGDPVKDRAQRMKGYVLVRENTIRKDFFSETEADSRKPPQKALSVKTILENRQFRLGACIAGLALLLGFTGFFVWKIQVHSRFEKHLKNTFAQASNTKVTIAFEEVTFALLGGVSRDQGTIRGLTITNRETKGTVKFSDSIDFELEASEKRLVTKPFNVYIDDRGSKYVMKDCVLEAEASSGTHLKFKADEVFSIVNGIEVFTVQRLEASFSTQGTEWKENPRFVLGDAEFGFRADDIHVWSESVLRDVDILVSIKNGLFAKDQPAADATPVNYMDIFRTKWGENKAVAVLERCSLRILGSEVKAGGKLEFKNPVEGSEANLRVSIKDFRHIMKYINRVSETAFDRIVVALVSLDEKKAAAYNQDSDFLDMTLSYKNSKVKINDQDLQSFI